MRGLGTGRTLTSVRDDGLVRALVFDRFQGPLTVREVPAPVAPPAGVVVRVGATGICRSDWHGWQGHDPGITLPHVPGHELAGTVAEVGAEVSRWQVGDRVTVPFVNACGACPRCLEGNQQVCDAQRQPGFTHWGSFAELVALDAADVNLVALPSALTFVTAAALGCRFATSYRAVRQIARVQPGEWVVVHGCGGVGLSAVHIAAAAGAQVIAVDTSAAALELATSLGAWAVVQPPDVVAQVNALTEGGAHVSVDALGSDQTASDSIRCLRARGRHVQVGLLPSLSSLPLSRVLARELQVLGSHGMAAHAYPEMLARIAAGELHPERLIGREITLDEAAVALAEVGQRPGMAVITGF
jgi:D-arabinose 1-dehydrogenase-like Zn-dependent alcohol dehydrogenase